MRSSVWFMMTLCWEISTPMKDYITNATTIAIIPNTNTTLKKRHRWRLIFRLKAPSVLSVEFFTLLAPFFIPLLKDDNINLNLTRLDKFSARSWILITNSKLPLINKINYISFFPNLHATIIRIYNKLMSRYCQANLCPGNCCDYYAYCSYPSISTVCYSQITYYYDSFWWVYTIAGIVLFIAIITALCVARRRRRRRRMQDTIIIN